MFKRVRLLFIPFVSVVLAQGTFAMAPGFYIGASLGPSSNNASEKTAYTINYQELCPATGPCPTLPTFPPSFSTLTAKPKVSMFGSRVMVVFNLMIMQALEGGLDYFSNIRYTTGTSNVCSPVRHLLLPVRLPLYQTMILVVQHLQQQQVCEV